MDTLDLYSARQRTVLSSRPPKSWASRKRSSAATWAASCCKLEELQDEQIKKALEPAKANPDQRGRKNGGDGLLRDPRLLDRIMADLERCGAVGEETNKLVVILPVSPGCWIRRWR